MNNLITKYNITLAELTSLDTYGLSVFNSFKEQYTIKCELSVKQLDLLNKILNRDIDVLNIQFEQMFLYEEDSYKLDHHDDYFLKSTKKISRTELNTAETIINLQAQQYNYADEIIRYVFIGPISVPTCITDLTTYVEYHYKFEILYSKLRKARSNNSKYNLITAIRSILAEKYNDSKINKLL